MNNISEALNDVKKHYNIKEIKKLQVFYDKTSVIMFTSNDKIFVVNIECFDSKTYFENNGEINENS